MRIRDFQVGDISTVHAINEASGPGVYSASPEKLAAILRESCIALVAEIEGAVAGFCQVLPPGASYASVNYKWFSARYDDFIYLDRVAVAPEHRNRGIGGRLYEEVERRASAAWFTLEINVRPPNEGSMRFHARRGFVEVGQQDTDSGTRVSLLVKQLRNG